MKYSSQMCPLTRIASVKIVSQIRHNNPCLLKSLKKPLLVWRAFQACVFTNKTLAISFKSSILQLKYLKLRGSESNEINMLTLNALSLISLVFIFPLYLQFEDCNPGWCLIVTRLFLWDALMRFLKAIIVKWNIITAWSDLTQKYFDLTACPPIT